MPSRASGCTAFSHITEDIARTASSTGRSAWAWKARLPSPTTKGLAAAILSANSRVAASSSLSGTTRFTSPQSSAVRASTKSPVSSISIARFRPTARVSGTIGVEQKSPIRTPGVAKRALSAATARSQAATSWQPAAVAMPRTSAMTGCGASRRAAMSRAQLSNSRRWPARSASRTSGR